MTNPGPLIDLSFDHIDLWSRSSDKGPVSSSRSWVRLIVWAGTSGKSLSRQVRQGVVVGFFTGCEGDLGKTCGDAGESGQSSWLVFERDLITYRLYSGFEGFPHRIRRNYRATCRPVYRRIQLFPLHLEGISARQLKRFPD